MTEKTYLDKAIVTRAGKVMRAWSKTELGGHLLMMKKDEVRAAMPHLAYALDMLFELSELGLDRRDYE